jgi:ADP-ribosylglycohydrolase
MNSKLHDAILGLAIGDALGVPYEFEKRGTFLCTEMVGYGTHNQPEGTWSDDTSMVLATLDSLKSNDGKIVLKDMFERFNYWLLYGDYTAHGEVFDAGIATCKALQTGKPQTGEYDNGNGSLMRILPLAFVPCTDDEIRAVSAITHGHRISMDACVIYVHIAKRLLAGESICEIIPTLQYDKPFDRLHRIDQISTSEIKSSGYVVDTLEAALWAVSHKSNNADKEKSFRNDLLDAVNLGQDTDTVGAVAGGLAGIIYGLDEVSDWVETLQNREELERYLW